MACAILRAPPAPAQRWPEPKASPCSAVEPCHCPACPLWKGSRQLKSDFWWQEERKRRARHLAEELGMAQRAGPAASTGWLGHRQPWGCRHPLGLRGKHRAKSLSCHLLGCGLALSRAARSWGGSSQPRRKLLINTFQGEVTEQERGNLAPAPAPQGKEEEDGGQQLGRNPSEIPSFDPLLPAPAKCDLNPPPNIFFPHLFSLK